jgi:hypothetical protein
MTCLPRCMLVGTENSVAGNRKSRAEKPSLLVLGVGDDLSPSVRVLLGLLAYSRWRTLRTVQGLGMAALDRRIDDKSNSIAVLLSHIAAVEKWYQADTFGEREFNAAEKRRWHHLVLLSPDVHGYVREKPLSHYVDVLGRVRRDTEKLLRQRSDRWLLRARPFGDTTANNLWKWIHVCENEVSHVGQIAWLIKRLPPSERASPL